MIITNILVIKKLAEYRSLFEQWQQIMKEQYGVSMTKPDDTLLLCHALDEGIEQMKDLLKRNGKKVTA